MKKRVNFQTLLHIDTKAVFQRSRRFVGDDVVHLCIVLVQVVNGTANLCMCGLFPLPPVPTLPELEILTVSAAECEVSAVVNGEDLATHHVENIWGNEMCPAATPADSPEALFQNVKVFVAAVYKGNGKRHFPQLFQILLFLTGTVPDKPEVAADDQNIAGFHFFENGIFETGQISVHVTCDIYQKEALLKK